MAADVRFYDVLKCDDIFLEAKDKRVQYTKKRILSMHGISKIKRNKRTTSA